MIFSKIDNRNKDLILAISLGSKSSALLTQSDGSIIGAYKEEHFTGIKNDSSFPIHSVISLLSELPDDTLYQLTITITHWFNSRNSDKTWERYYTDVKDLIKTAFKNKHFVIKKIIEANNLHDCLAETARSYILSCEDVDDFSNDPITIIVANRFGNFENVASTYTWWKFSDFKEGEEPIVNKLNDFKSSIGMMQQIASKHAGYLEYDITKGLLTLNNDYEIQKTRSNGLSLYSKQSDWDKYDRYKDTVLFDISEVSHEEIISRALRKSKDIYDYRPISVKKIDQLNDHYTSIFRDMNKEQIVSYVYNKTYQALSDLITPHKDGHVILIGDAFISDDINEELEKICKKKMIVSPFLEDNTAIFGATNKILEKIYYNSLDLSDYYVVNRQITGNFSYDFIELEDYKVSMTPKELSKFFRDNVYTIPNDSTPEFVKRISDKLEKGNIINIVFSKGSFSETLNYASMSIAKEEFHKDLLLIASDTIDRKYELLPTDTGIVFLDELIKSIGANLAFTNFSTSDNITPIFNDMCAHALINQIEKKEEHNLQNDINLIVVK